MDIIRRYKDFHSEEIITDVLFTGVNNELSQQIIKLWNASQKFLPESDLLEASEGHELVESKWKKVFNVTSRKEPEVVIGAIPNTAIAAKLIHFWNKHNWVVESDLFLDIQFNGEKDEVYYESYKIITKSNFDKELFEEKPIAEGLSYHWAETLVNEWNNKHWTEHSDIFLKVVKDSHKPYNGYRENGYY